MTLRYRQESATLAACDRRLIGLAGTLLETLDGRDHAWILAKHATITDAITLIWPQVRDRQSFLRLGTGSHC
jgi:hypothetical protein